MDELEVKLELWKKTIEVQMHFNELEMKIRNFAILLISAFIGGAGLALKEGMNVSTLNMSLASLLLYSAAVLTIVFYLADRFWYHPLLLGSVKHGLIIEDSLKESGFPEAGLTKSVGDASGVKLAFTNIKIRSSKKIAILYIPMFILFVALGLSLDKPTAETKPIQRENQTLKSDEKTSSTKRNHEENDRSFVTINLNNNHSWNESEAQPKAATQYLDSCLRVLSTEKNQNKLCSK